MKLAIKNKFKVCVGGEAESDSQGPPAFPDPAVVAVGTVIRATF